LGMGQSWRQLLTTGAIIGCFEGAAAGAAPAGYRAADTIAAAAAAASDRVALRDAPIAAQSVRYLDGRWTASTSGDPERGVLPDTIEATVPGDIISDLFSAGRIGNPLFELNFKNHTLWDLDWTYSTTFDLPPGWSMGETMVLVLDGVKMGATVSLNGKTLGTITDQFLRHTFDVGQLMVRQSSSSSNVLAVSFKSSIDCGGRWMACTGGWDW
jgi:beta-mannosidase